MSLDNKTSSPDQLDQFAKHAVHTIQAQIDIPDPTESWNKMSLKLNKRAQRARWLRVTQIGIAIACLSLVIGLFSSYPSPAFAFKQVIQIIKDTQAGIVNIIFGESNDQSTNGMLTPPPPDIGGPEVGISSQSPSNSVISEPKVVSLEQAAQLTAFTLQSPTWLPEGYQLDRIEVYPNLNGNHTTVRMEYSNGTDWIMFMQKMTEKFGTAPKVSVKEEAGEVKPIQINQADGILVSYTNGGGFIEWISSDTLTMMKISGNVTEDELSKIAKSVTKKEDQ